MPDEANEKAPNSDREELRFTFGELESRLARLHEISSDKRTQFQARLRNFQRLGFPKGMSAGRGKTVHYSPGHVAELALVLELTQLGLLPERVVQVFNANRFPISQAVRIATNELVAKGGFRPWREREMENTTLYHGAMMREGTEETDPLSMFLYFDPTALASLTDIPEKYEDQASASFFYGGAGIVRENIVKWTAGPFIRRLSFINVTAMLWELVVRSKPDRQQAFLSQVAEWADALELDYMIEAVPDEEQVENAVVIETPEDVLAHAETLKNMKGLPRPVANAMIERAQRIMETGKLPNADDGLTGKPIVEMSNDEFNEEMVGRLVLGGLPEMVARTALAGEPATQAQKDESKRIGDRVEKAKSKRRREDGDG